MNTRPDYVPTTSQSAQGWSRGVKAERKGRIRALRLAGKGYKAIARELGVTRDSVRGVCRRTGLLGAGPLTEADVARAMPTRPTSCDVCAGPLPAPSGGPGGPRKHCGQLCRGRAARSARHERELRAEMAER